jgi:mannose-6-phosphate isomerase-like protein (cupin superfamily)
MRRRVRHPCALKVTVTPMQARILNNQHAEEFDTTERCFITEWSNSADDAAASVARARVSPGVSTQWHRLQDTTERYVMLQGVGRVEIGEMAPQDIHPGDVVVIPPGCRQRITNIGATDLVFLAICTPRFEVANYEAL